MQMRMDRLTTLGHRKRSVGKNKEGTPEVAYTEPTEVTGYSWPGGGQVQAAQYGKELPYVRNIRLAVNYTAVVQDGVRHYHLDGGPDIMELDRMVIEGLEYEIRAIKPYRYLELEAVQV